MNARIGNFVEEHDLGHATSNDSWVLVGRNPDTVRGGDVAHYSYGRVPQGPLPAGYLDVVPELVFEVRSPTDRWSHTSIRNFSRADRVRRSASSWARISAFWVLSRHRR